MQLVAGDECKSSNIAMKLCESEFETMKAETMEKREIFHVFRFKIIESKSTKIRKKNVAWNIILPTCIEKISDIGKSLALSCFKVLACGLMLDQQLTGPK